MKKFYSIIAIASLMLTSVLSFTSCQKDEMPAPKTAQPAQPAVTTTITTESPSDGSGYLAVSTNGSQVNVSAKVSNGNNLQNKTYAVGIWKASVNGTDYTLTVSGNSAEGKCDIVFKSTLSAGDKVYDGEFSASLRNYTGIFESAEGTTSLKDLTFNESNFSEFTAETLDIEGTTVAENVKFVKQ